MHTKNAMEILSKLKIKIEHISGPIFIQLVFIVYQVEDYQNILKLSADHLL